MDILRVAECSPGAVWRMETQQNLI